jgi:hypothetical protein
MGSTVSVGGWKAAEWANASVDRTTGAPQVTVNFAWYYSMHLDSAGLECDPADQSVERSASVHISHFPGHSNDGRDWIVTITGRVDKHVVLPVEGNPFPVQQWDSRRLRDASGDWPETYRCTTLTGALGRAREVMFVMPERLRELHEAWPDEKVERAVLV